MIPLLASEPGLNVEKMIPSLLHRRPTPSCPTELSIGLLPIRPVIAGKPNFATLLYKVLNDLNDIPGSLFS